MSRPTLGLVMILRDEAANLERSLAPVAACFDEVVAVDTGSRDATPRLAASLGARVSHFPWRDDFAQARNFSLDQARADWLFWLDGDNAITPEAVQDLRERLPAEGPAILWALEQVEPGGARLWQKRAFPRRPEVRFVGRVHEQLTHPGHWPGVVTPVVVRHWGYLDPARNAAKGRYYLGLLEQMLDNAPADFYARFQAGRCHLNLREFAQAAEQFAHLARLEPARDANPELWVHGHCLWAQALERLGRPEEAVAVLEGLLAAAPGHGLALFQRGRLAYSLGDWAGAARCLGQALEAGLGAPLVDLDPDKTLFLAEYYLGRSHERLGQPGRAASALARAVERDPANLAARTDLARVLLALGQPGPARAHLEQILQARPQDRQAQALLSQMERAA